MVRIFCLTCVALCLASPQLSAQESVVAPNATPQKIIGDCSFTEGPATDADGNVYFTDQPNNRILKIDVAGNVSTFMQPAGRSNGMFFAPDGKLIACADENNELWEISADGSHRILAKDFAGKKLNGPNDLWIHPDGWMVFTDPFYKRPWWQHNQMPQDACYIYRVQRDGTNLVRVEGKFKQPNGIIGDKERGYLYVADIGDKKTYRYEINAQGDLVNRQLFCELGSDGMTIDVEGNIYLTGNQGVTVVGPDGKTKEIIAIPEPWSANVCFGGKDRKTLFVTASKTVYAVAMRVAGQ
jgi:gluconolactonase